MPTEELIRYFESKPSTKFIDLDSYKSMVGREREKYLISFLTELGVKSSPSVYVESNDDYYNQSSEKFVDGLIEIIEAVEESMDSDLSAFLWQQLCIMVETNKLNYYLLKKTLRTRPDGRYNFRTKYEDSSTKIDLTSKKWLVNNEGVFVSAKELTKSELSSIYDIENEGAASLLSILNIFDIGEDDDEDDDEDDSYLTDTQREKIEFANKLKTLGINEEDLEDFREFKRQKEAQKRTAEIERNSGNSSSSSEQKNTGTEDIDDLFEDEEDKENSELKEKKKINKATTDVIKDIARRTKERGTAVSIPEITDDDDTDEDEFMPSAVDYSKKIERAKQKSAAEIDKITYFEELQNKAVSAERYSYSWFTTLLEMESINSGEANSRSREVSISFTKVEREPGTKRTLVLKHPNRYIPQFMEDLADIPLVLHMGDQTKTVAIEVANIKSYTLQVKMKNTEAIDDIDLSTVTSATIDAKSPAFLLEELRKQFANFGFSEDFNMQENLCENIEFVFGPPGTGKTTHLAKNILLPIMKNSRECKVLVLTPTNKSADVLVKRIMEVSGGDTSYNDWLVRFGATGDEEIEQSPVFRDKTFDIRTLVKNVTVTTIARFPYDFFMPDGARVFLNGMNWDYIIIDEASMIPLANIVYPLYKKTPKKFIIAGDPFQIEPITSIDLWKNENIYTMVHLDSFVEPETIPYQYKVELLTTQYRSVPDIGGIFSNFAYGGILKHFRSADSQRPLNVGNDLGIETLNVIKFPVSKYESIYRCKRLQHSSSYQVYSAIFTFEYVSYLSRAIAENNPGELFRIGVIAPYRAQADMIDKLLASENLPKEVDVQVGTIHGFQGDECDIVFAVFNTPPSISASKEMFLNKKNIINVSISRARDYLFVVMPDDETENIDNLRLVKRVEGLIQSTDAWNEFASPDLEDLMFGDSKYLENNAFSTSHQSVNVYSLPEKIYEVRTEDTAVDVQIHRELGQVAPVEKLANNN
ncbi:MAG: DEAD/DEAH box helicase [Lachnospiraceae bacterium]|nr:DEAD/DEAH box helicase [Lachnospiraceae bacterium]